MADAPPVPAAMLISLTPSPSLLQSGCMPTWVAASAARNVHTGVEFRPGPTCCLQPTGMRTKCEMVCTCLQEAMLINSTTLLPPTTVQRSSSFRVLQNCTNLSLRQGHSLNYQVWCRGRDTNWSRQAWERDSISQIPNKGNLKSWHSESVIIWVCQSTRANSRLTCQEQPAACRRARIPIQVILYSTSYLPPVNVLYICI